MPRPFRLRGSELVDGEGRFFGQWLAANDFVVEDVNDYRQFLVHGIGQDRLAQFVQHFLLD